jgi:glutathione S-transferase
VAGGRFTAADVMVGAVTSMRLVTGELPALPFLTAYVARCRDRPAFQRAEAINWPPELFEAARKPPP